MQTEFIYETLLRDRVARAIWQAWNESRDKRFPALALYESNPQLQRFCYRMAEAAIKTLEREERHDTTRSPV